tara:strand:- start:578 stop:1405 length:828 start_codon:yes stop_codon:yes gene_type:complete
LNPKSNFFEIFNKVKFRSLKHSNYFEIYDELFEKYREKKITFVEIGVTNGGSLMMWREYFKEANIIGIDFNPSAKKWEEYGFKIFIGDQSDPKFWTDFFSKVGKIDILIDDGGHTNQQQISTFHSCYENINENGIILFEDTHSSYLKEFGNPSKYSFMNFCYNLVDVMNKKIIHQKIPPYLKRIYKIEFYQSIVVFFFNKDTAKASHAVDNKGEVINAEDFRLKDTKVFNFIDKIKDKFRRSVNIKIYNLLKKIYPIFKYLVFKLKNRKNKKFFK